MKILWFSFLNNIFFIFSKKIFFFDFLFYFIFSFLLFLCFLIGSDGPPYCSIEMWKLEQNGRHNGHAFILATCHFCDELVKLTEDFTAAKLLLKKLKHHLGV